MSESIFRFSVGDRVTPACVESVLHGETGLVDEQFASDGKVVVNVKFDNRKSLIGFRDYDLRLVEPAPTVNEPKAPQQMFKVGDRVRVVSEQSAFKGRIGQIDKMKECGARMAFRVKSSDNSIHPCYYYGIDLEPAPAVNECLTVDNAQTTGKQAFIQARYDCIDPLALRLVAECVGFGARKYGEHNHKKISVRDHLNHAVNHILEHRIGDQSEMHLVHAIARLFFAVELVVHSGAMEDRYFHPDMVEGVLSEVTSE
jgi:hypothetical protein